MRSISLTPGLWDLATDVGQARFDRALEAERKNTNGGVFSVDQHIWGARCEVAALWYLRPIHWESYVHDGDLQTLPDLGDFIDVKAVKDRDGFLNLWRNEPRKHRRWAFLAVGHSQARRLGGHFDLLGWVYGDEALSYFVDLTKQSERERLGTHLKRPAHLVPQDRLRPVDELLAIVRERY